MQKRFGGMMMDMMRMCSMCMMLCAQKRCLPRPISV